MATPEQFSRRIAALGKQVAERADKTVRAAALAADQVVVLATPVDVGRARSNWIVELDAPSRETVEPFAPGSGGDTGGENAAGALAQGQATIAFYDGDRNTGIAISNNLPYIGALNDGSSRQAPAGFVQRGVQSAVKQVRNARLVT